MLRYVGPLLLFKFPPPIFLSGKVMRNARKICRERDFPSPAKRGAFCRTPLPAPERPDSPEKSTRSMRMPSGAPGKETAFRVEGNDVPAPKGRFFAEGTGETPLFMGGRYGSPVWSMRMPSGAPGRIKAPGWKERRVFAESPFSSPKGPERRRFFYG